MIYSPKSIANYFLELASSKDESITPMKLQKLVYYAQGWYAGYTSKPLINETIEAWQYGPVVSSLYHEFKQFGSSVIRSKATDFDSENLSFCVVPSPKEEPIRKFLANVWGSYGQYTGIKLSEMTHAEGSPWALTWKKCGSVKGVDIPLILIIEHFKSAVESSKKKVIS